MKKTLGYLVLSLAVAMMCAPMAQSEQKKGNDAAVMRNLEIFNSLYKELNTFYVDTINSKKAMETAIDAMLGDLDPYTEYIPAEKQDEFMSFSTGEYGGIGSYIMYRKGKGVCISGPYKDSPAARAGLRSGDRIVEIDGDSVVNSTSEEVSRKLKGMVNTQVTVKVVRPFVADSVKTFAITREKIKIAPVPYYGVVRGNIGYIKLNTYNEHSAEQVKAALLALKANPAVKNIVLDLRGNGGGLVNEAIKIVSFFVPKGTRVLEQRARTTANYKVYKTSESPIVPDMPLAVLVDGGSASASEITAGALQDLDRAVIVGSRSFGKGLVQSTRTLPYDGMLKVTIAKYYIPSGRLIQEVDYSKRNADGSAVVKSDSLANVFHTAHGREVRDGGGITPDIKVDFPEANRLMYNLVRDNWMFDFATKYVAEHETIPSPSQFTVTDEMFEAFKASIDKDKFNYDKVCEVGLTNLRKVAEAEGYMTDSVKAEFDRMEKMLKHNLDQDLDHNRKQISRYLADEIVQRYYYDAGEIEFETVNDECVDKASEMFDKAGEYEKILCLAKPKATKEKGKKK